MVQHLGVMFKPVVEHTGPWTIADVEALPDLGDHARYEILEPGVLTISPPQYGSMHQRVSGKLRDTLDTAARAAGLDVEALTGMNVEIPHERLATPDVVIVDTAISDNDPTRLPPSAAQLVVEIVSPSSEMIDRLIKPGLYAAARIPFYWRFEFEPEALLSPYVLRGDTYEQLASLRGGARRPVPAPFAIELDPNDLLRR